ncbi:MAG: hypothetical protein AB4911_12645 [Oscillochloridaceae bacterium umkhey_bin13]
MIGYIYLLHFTRPLGNLAHPLAQARHYVGWARDPEARNAEHQAGRGAALTRAALASGITWELFILAEGGRTLERRIKALRAAPRLCPICGQDHPGGRLRVPHQPVEQLTLDLDPEPWPAPPRGGPCWAEIAYDMRVRSTPPALDPAELDAFSREALGVPW